jgi:uncharacterized protein (DUF305 family)
MGQPTISVSGTVRALLVGGALLLSNCRSGPDETADVHEPGAPATMMAALHTMAEHSLALPPTSNLDLYFAQLMRENHRAAVAMSALELQRGRDPVLLAIAKDIHQAHRRLIPGLDSAVARINAQPPTYPEHTQQSHELAQLLEAATKGLHPAAHRIIAGDTIQPRPSSTEEENSLAAGTGDVDRDYAALLIPHHENSISLARAELKLGRDEKLIKAAYLILVDQQKEIEQVQAWLGQHPTK